MKKIFFSTAIMLYGIAVSAADNWQTYFKNKQVEILYRYSDCHDNANGIHQQKILLRFVNLTDKKEEVVFYKEYTYSNYPAPKPDKSEFGVVLNPNETKQGECDAPDRTFTIFSKQLNFKSAELTKFELKDISVKTIQ